MTMVANELMNLDEVLSEVGSKEYVMMHPAG